MHTKTRPHLQSVLIPVDKTEHSERAVKFAARLVSPISPEITKKVTLIHIIAYSYLEKMASNIDIRFKNILESPLFKRILEQHVEKEVNPFLEEFAKIFKENKFSGELEKHISQGEPGKEIVTFAEKNNIESIIMGRRKRSHTAETLLGSCSHIVIHRAKKQNIFIVGQEVREEGCPVNKILVPVDGSRPSYRAVKEAAAIANCFPEGMVQVSIISVLDPIYLDQNSDEEKEVHKIIEKARQILKDEGLNDGQINSYLEFGDPGRTIARIADEEGFPLIMMGRTGKSGLREIVLGSVSTRVIHKVEKATVGLVPIKNGDFID
ncbi:universal stress protein [Thermodesulfatator atlanticus]|uniref:universal stress protein n=1 Tax=Thermodesulfatator atlanticus TaxID=501497 RepID=UPI0003B5526C|nr:universal stress protein [Thermodesulfatator atlanticus]